MQEWFAISLQSQTTLCEAQNALQPSFPRMHSNDGALELYLVSRLDFKIWKTQSAHKNKHSSLNCRDISLSCLFSVCLTDIRTAYFHHLPHQDRAWRLTRSRIVACRAPPVRHGAHTRSVRLHSRSLLDDSESARRYVHCTNCSVLFSLFMISFVVSCLSDCKKLNKHKKHTESDEVDYFKHLHAPC